MSHQNAFCLVTLSPGAVSVLQARISDYREAEKRAKELAILKQEPVYIMRAAVKIVPPEAVCTIVPLKAAFEVG